MILYAVANGDLQKAEWIKWNVPAVEAYKWICLKDYVNKKAQDKSQ